MYGRSEARVQMSRVIYERHEPIDVEMIQNTEDEVSIDLSTVHPLDFCPLFYVATLFHCCIFLCIFLYSALAYTIYGTENKEKFRTMLGPYSS